MEFPQPPLLTFLGNMVLDLIPALASSCVCVCVCVCERERERERERVSVCAWEQEKNQNVLDFIPAANSKFQL